MADQNKIFDASKAVINLTIQLRLNGAILIMFDQGDRTVLSWANTEAQRSDIQQLAVELHKRMFEGDIAVPPSLG